MELSPDLNIGRTRLNFHLDGKAQVDKDMLKMIHKERARLYLLNCNMMGGIPPSLEPMLLLSLSILSPLLKLIVRLYKFRSVKGSSSVCRGRLSLDLNTDLKFSANEVTLSWPLLGNLSLIG